MILNVFTHFIQSKYAAYAVFERLSLQCLAVFRFIRVLPCKETSHMNAPKIFKAQLLHTSPPFCLSNPMSPLEMSNAWHRVALEFAKRKHLNWSWYKQLLLSPLSSTPESTPYSRSSRNPTALLNHFTTSFWKVAVIGSSRWQVSSMSDHSTSTRFDRQLQRPLAASPNLGRKAERSQGMPCRALDSDSLDLQNSWVRRVHRVSPKNSCLFCLLCLLHTLSLSISFNLFQSLP